MPSHLSTCVPGRHADDHRLAVGAVALRALAVAAAVGAEVRAAAEGLQVAQRVVDAQDDVAAAAAVAAVGAALGHVRLAPERQAPLPPAPARTSSWARSVSTAPNGSHRRHASCLPHHRRLDRHRRRHRPPGRRGRLPGRARRPLEDKLESLASEVGGLAVRCDVTEWEDQQALVQRTLDEYGRIDVAFANAGFGGPRGFEKGTPEEWKEMVLTNVYGVALTIRATMQALKDSKGHLLITSSVAGRRALQGSLYSATKHAVTAMGEAARLDFNDTGVRVTLIEPGMVDTPFFDDPPRIEALQADDIARAVMFAVSQPPHVDVNEILVRPTAQPT